MNEDVFELAPDEFSYRRPVVVQRRTAVEPRQALEVLLDLAHELETESSLEDVVVRFVTRVSALVPGCQLEVRIDRAHSQAPALRGSAPPRSGFRFHDSSPPDSEPPASDRFDDDTAHVIPLLGLGASCLRLERTTTELPSLWELEFCCKAGKVLSGALRRHLTQRALEARTQEAERLRAQLVHSDRLATLGQLVAGVVHELNNPLTAILAYSEYLRGALESRPARPEDLQRLQRIQEAAQHILGFSRDLSDYARPQRNERRRVALQEVVERALGLCEHELGSSGIRVEVSTLAGLPELLGVPGQLTQVFVNLFSNAIQAMPSGGLLLVEAALAEGGSELSIRVRDTGCGIPPAHLDRVFEPFFTTKPDGQGTGLGLAIVREIVEGHSGSVSLESEALRGTTFTLRLPLSP